MDNCEDIEGAMMSGFEITSMILTSCLTYSVHRLQIVLPCCHCSANETSAECCLEFVTTWHHLGGGGHLSMRNPQV